MQRSTETAGLDSQANRVAKKNSASVKEYFRGDRFGLAVYRLYEHLESLPEAYATSPEREGFMHVTAYMIGLRIALHRTGDKGLPIPQDTLTNFRTTYEKLEAARSFLLRNDTSVNDEVYINPSPLSLARLKLNGLRIAMNLNPYRYIPTAFNQYQSGFNKAMGVWRSVSTVA